MQLDEWMDAGWPSGRPEGPQDPEDLSGGGFASVLGPYASPRIQRTSPAVVLLLFLGPYSLAHWRLKAQGYKTRDYRIQDTDRDRAAGYKTAELIRLRTENSPPCLAA